MAGSPRLAWIAAELEALAEKGLRRSLDPLGSGQGPTVSVGGRRLLNLSSNDYLVLATDPRVVEGACASAPAEGAGGRRPALLFGSASPANAGVPPALVGRDDAVFADELNHASILDGCLLSRAELVRYRHGD